MFKHDMAMFKDAIPMLNDAIPMLNDAIPMFKHVIPSERSHMDWNKQWKERGWWRGGACGTRLRAKTFVTSRSEMRSAQSWATPQWSSPWLRPRLGSASVSPGGTRVEKHRARGRKFVATMAVWISQGGACPVLLSKERSSGHVIAGSLLNVTGLGATAQRRHRLDMLTRRRRRKNKSRTHRVSLAGEGPGTWRAGRARAPHWHRCRPTASTNQRPSHSSLWFE
jgi:hypothetical protein